MITHFQTFRNDKDVDLEITTTKEIEQALFAALATRKIELYHNSVTSKLTIRFKQPSRRQP